MFRWWRRSITSQIDHERVVQRIWEESGWTGRYAFMTMMSAGIAVLGLLLSSPAVVIGAMLISPLMGPILGLGFSLALFDFAEMRRSLTALAIGAGAALAFTALIVLVSPLKAPTAEILARTRPNLFDLLVALFAALAGTYAIIRGRGDTIVGVAIATALMPPLAVVGYGLATMNVPVLSGALALFVTNFLTIALSATILARFYGFGHALSERQSWTQTIVLSAVFVAMAVPLGIALGHIARETLVASQVRSFLSQRFGDNARITQLDIDFDANPIVVRSIIIAPRAAAKNTNALEGELAGQIKQPVKLRLDQVLLDSGAGSLEAQRAELRQASGAVAAEQREASTAAQLVAVAAGVKVEDVVVDRDHRRVTATAQALAGADPQALRVLESRIASAVPGWQIAIVPPLGQLPEIAFADNVDTLDREARDAVLLSAWEARRWNIPALGVPGLPDGEAPESPTLNQRRAMAIAGVLREQGVNPVPAPDAGQRYRLAPAQP